MAHLILRIGDSIFADEFQLDQLQQLVGVGDSLEDGTEVV